MNSNSRPKFDSEDMALATSILAAIKKIKFAFMLHCMKDLLQTIEPANNALQSREIGYRQAIPIISETITQLQKYRTEEKFQLYYSAAALLTGTEENPHVEESRRVRQRSTLLADSVIGETLGEWGDNLTEIKSAYFDIIDNISVEIKDRFTENDRILSALSSAHEMEPESLKILTSLGLAMPSDAELCIAKKYLSKKKEEKKNIRAIWRAERIVSDAGSISWFVQIVFSSRNIRQ